jgi:hypothetical protein
LLDWTGQSISPSMPALSSTLAASFALDNKRRPARCFRGGRAAPQGLLRFAPVGFGGATVKGAPPLTITTNAEREGLTALEEAIAAAMAAPGRA